MNPRSTRHVLAGILTLGLGLAAGCESKPDRRAMMEEARRAVPPMAAKETFFNGQVVAHLTLASGMSEGGGADRSDSGGGGGRRGGGGRHGGTGGHGGRGGGYSGGEMGGASGPAEGSAIVAETRHNESTMPPAMLRLRLENTAADPIVVEVRELNSELGNFAVRPDTLTIAAGQSAEPDPMESLLGLDTYSLPVTVTLRSAGKTETKILTLHLVNPAPGTPPAAP